MAEWCVDSVFCLFILPLKCLILHLFYGQTITSEFFKWVLPREERTKADHYLSVPQDSSKSTDCCLLHSTACCPSNVLQTWNIRLYSFPTAEWSYFSITSQNDLFSHPDLIVCGHGTRGSWSVSIDSFVFSQDFKIF